MLPHPHQEFGAGDERDRWPDAQQGPRTPVRKPVDDVGGDRHAYPQTSGFFRQLATLGRLIMFDKRDTGLSDRGSGDMSLEERMEDLRTVMGAAGSSRAVLFGYSEGAPMSLLFTATHPERVTALILGSASARWLPASGYPCGQE